MASAKFSLLVFSVSLYIVYKILSLYISNLRFRVFALERGCQPPHYELDKLFWGLGRLRRMLQMGKSGEDFFDDILGEVFHNGTHTIESRTG